MALKLLLNRSLLGRGNGLELSCRSKQDDFKAIIFCYIHLMQLHPIAHIQSIYKEKFGTPRQSGLVTNEKSKINFEANYCFEDFTRGLDGMSHIWLVFGFHLIQYKEGQSTVRPPRLGGKERIGVFASRTPHRPNQLGLSLVELIEVHKDCLIVSGADLVHETPIFDIKPYHPQADRPGNFQAGYIDQLTHHSLQVEWETSPPNDHLRLIAENILSQDPRPSFHKDQDKNREYGVLIENYNFKFKIENKYLKILSYERV